MSAEESEAFWSRVPIRPGHAPKTRRVQPTEPPRLEVERGPLNTEERPEPISKTQSYFKRRAARKSAES
jgi:hypothetical protein